MSNNLLCSVLHVQPETSSLLVHSAPLGAADVVGGSLEACAERAHCITLHALP